MKEIVLDFETRSFLDLKKVGAWRYAQDPTTEIICAVFHSDERTETWIPGQSQDYINHVASDPEYMLLSFGDFERAIWKEIMEPEFGLPALPNERWSDIQALAAMKQMPKDLDTLVQVLELPVRKDMEGNKITKAMSKLGKKGNYGEQPTERIISYCRRDAEIEKLVFNVLGVSMPPRERRAWLLNQTINQRGLGLDLQYIRACKEIIRQATSPLGAEFRQLTGLNPTQVGKFREWVCQQGFNLPNLTKQTLIEILGDEENDTNEGIALEELDLPPTVERALRIRQQLSSASIKKLTAMETCVCFDGRARGLLQYHGTGPGRSSGRLLQPQNFPRPTVQCGMETVIKAIMVGSAKVVEEVVGAAIPTVVTGLRYAIKAGEGKIFLSGDYAGIQARLVLALAGQHDKTALMASGQDVYCDMGSRIHGRPINKKDDPEERQDGKNSVLGLGFEMGARKFQEKYARRRPLSFAEHVVKVYREEWAPEVPKVWRGLARAATEAVWSGQPQEAYGIVYQIEGRWLTATAPSGSKIWYFNPQKTRRPVPWNDDEIREGFSYQAEKNHCWRTIDAFGGLLTENIIMRMEADIMCTAQLKLEENGFPVVLEVHDEILCEPLLANADEKAFQQILLDVDPWVHHLKVPIAVEGWKGERYRK